MDNDFTKEQPSDPQDHHAQTPDKARKDSELENNLQDYVFITNLVHDEINLEVKEEYAELAARNLERCMKEAANKWCKTIQLTADAVVTNYWNH
jgi:DNA polymerase I-like protein with 3'-5' exonuclease and polymerase domains